MEKNPNLTVVIPAKNEYATLQILLYQLRKQTYKDLDIVVADSSDDRITWQVCQDEGVSTVRGGLPGHGRNRGAEFSRAEYILFLDADMHLQRDFVEKALEAMQKKKADCLSFGFYCRGSKLIRRLHSLIACYFFIMTKLGFPHAIGGAILVKRSVHEDIGGFDEKIAVLEDFNYAKRISKKYKYFFVLHPLVGVSTRRIQKVGLKKLIVKYIKMEFYRIFFGEIRKNKFKYFD